MPLQSCLDIVRTRRVLLSTVSIGVVAAIAPGGLAIAQTVPAQSPSSPTAAVQNSVDEIGAGDEIVVTASRRETKVSELPFNISAYGGRQLERANISSVAALTQQVPNFVIEDRGARSIVSSIPVIRGLNASIASVSAARYFQSPVGFYLGNAPITGGLPLFDIERIEVLRGPQGTLYGAGVLSGAVRIVPAEPRLRDFSGMATASVGALAHSDKFSHTLGAVLNVPVGENLAVRVNGRYEYAAGFIDQHDILKREDGNYESGVPVLADPTDVAGSPGSYFDKDDVDKAKTTSFRVALKWEPTDDLSIGASYDYAYAKGVGGPTDNNSFDGGPSPLDPRITLRPTGDYERSSPLLEPFDRRTQLAAFDASYDMGFATLSTTLAYGQTRGKTVADSTQNLLGSPYGYYYTGSPANPRAVIPVTNTDNDRSFTEEIRLVSTSGRTFDYIAGVFLQQQKRKIGLKVWDPGADTYSAAAHGGSTLPIAAGGTYVILFPDGSSYVQNSEQKFNDYSAYGELTWHLTPEWQVTGGARVFHQTFDAGFQQASSFFFFETDVTNSSKVTSQIFKVNTSYKLDEKNQFYATWSQGFRRGGSNAFPTSGIVLEPTELLNYDPDKTNNFEAGFKGSLGGILYAVDAFYVDWDKPQIDINTPYNLTPVVINGSKASSKGFELEASGPLFLDGLTFNAGVAYAKARLTKDFNLPAGASGTVVPDAITGRKGDRLPGAPDVSGSITLNYEASYGSDTSITYSVGADYRSSTVNQLSSISANTPTRRTPGYALLRASISAQHGGWGLELYGTNLADKRAVLSVNSRSLSSYSLLGDWGNSYSVARPREVGLRLTRNF